MSWDDRTPVRHKKTLPRVDIMESVRGEVSFFDQGSFAHHKELLQV